MTTRRERLEAERDKALQVEPGRVHAINKQIKEIDDKAEARKAPKERAVSATKENTKG